MLSHGTYTRTDGENAGGVYPRFFIEAVPDPIASAKEGRPIFRDMETVEIILPGNTNTMPVHRVSDEDRHRWPEAYAAFKRGQEIARVGTPLEDWCALGRAQVQELKAINLATVEEVANVSDVVAQKIMGLGNLRAKAQAWLDDAKETAIVGSLQHENEQLKSQLSSQQQQIDELRTLTNQLHGELIGLRNAPHHSETMTQAQIDPMQALARSGAEAGPSSLAAFAEDAPRSRRRREAVTEETLVG